MSPERLLEIRECWMNASPGQWNFRPHYGEGYLAITAGKRVVAVLRKFEEADEQDGDNAVLICNAHNAYLPELINDYDSLRALCKQLRDALAEGVSCLEGWGPAPVDAFYIKETARPALKAYDDAMTAEGKEKE